MENRSRGKVLVFNDKGRGGKVSKRLGAIGYAVTTAPDLTDLVDRATRQVFDLVLADLEMSKVDAATLVRTLRAGRIDLPVVILGSEAREERAPGAASVLFQLSKAKGLEGLEELTKRAVQRHQQVAEMRHAIAAVRHTSPDRVEVAPVSATQARQEFARLLDRMAHREVVIINKQNEPKAVLISIDDFTELLGPPAPKLDTLTAEFDAMLARMQTPEAKRGVAAAFDLSGGQLGAAALKAARRRNKRG